VFKASEALCVKRITVGSKKAIAEQQNVKLLRSTDYAAMK
jgi:hypothetical protein